MAVTSSVTSRPIFRQIRTYWAKRSRSLFLGTMCPELSRAERWKSRGWEIVLQEARRQVQSDGFHFEQSAYYHVYAIDFFLHAAVLASLNEFAITSEFEKTLEKMLDALLLLGRAGAPRIWATTTEVGCSIPSETEASICWIRLPLEPCSSIAGISKLRLESCVRKQFGCWENKALQNGIACRTQPADLASADLQSAGLYFLTTANPPTNW